MLNKEKSKEYEKYLMKKKAELVKYLKGKAVGFEKFASMDEYLCEVKEEEELCDEGDAFRLYESVNIALAGYLNRQSNEFLLDSLCIDDANDAIAYMFGKKFKRNKIDLVELIEQLNDDCADFSDSDHYLLSKLNKSYIKFLENKILHIQMITGQEFVMSKAAFQIKDVTINAGGSMIIDYQCIFKEKVSDGRLWIGVRYLSMSDELLKKNAKQKKSVLGWKY
jgi:hypothetical protein